MPSLPKINHSGSRPEQSDTRPTGAQSTSRPSRPYKGADGWTGAGPAEQSDSGSIAQLLLPLLRAAQDALAAAGEQTDTTAINEG